MPEQSHKIEAWFDGALDCTTGRAAFGFMVCQGDRIVFTGAGYIGNGASIGSEATEYAALIATLRYLKANGIIRATVYGDAANVIQTAQGLCSISPRHYAAASELIALVQTLPDVRLRWIPRRLNGQANTLARLALANHAASTNNENITHQGDAQKQVTPKRRKRFSRARRRARRILSRLIDRLS